MKKSAIVIALSLVLVVLASCASTSQPAQSGSVTQDSQSATVQNPVVYGKDGVPRPEWVTKDVSTQDVHFATGYGKMTNFANSQKRALAEARNAIAEWISTSVDEIIVTYTNDAGEGANRQAIDAFETISKQQSTAWISGSMQEALWEDAEGGVYVLVSIPVANVKEPMVEVAEGVNEQVFETNEAAAAANAMMDEAIAKYFSEL